MITILDEKGQTVRTLKTEKAEDLEHDDFSRQRSKPFEVPKHAGINRIWWDLRYDRTKMIKLRTSPLGHDHVRVGSNGWRPFPRGSRTSGPLVPPGVYTVKLTVGDRSVTQKLVIRKDPHSAGTETDIQAQTKIMLEIYKEMDLAADLINQIEWIRKQIDGLKDLLEQKERMQPIIEAADELDMKLIDIERFSSPWTDRIRRWSLLAR